MVYPETPKTLNPINPKPIPVWGVQIGFRGPHIKAREDNPQLCVGLPWDSKLYWGYIRVIFGLYWMILGSDIGDIY